MSSYESRFPFSAMEAEMGVPMPALGWGAEAGLAGGAAIEASCLERRK